MSDLVSRLELAKLCQELEADESELAFLLSLDPDELRLLRGAVSHTLHTRHEARFHRMAAVSKLVPPGISARASAMVGPVLSARVAGALDPEHAVRLAKAMRPEQLVAVTHHLDPGRVSELVRALPRDLVVTVGAMLLEQREYLTLGRFTSVVDPDTALEVARDADGSQLLHLALHTEDRPALDAIVTRIDGARLAAAVQASADSGEYDEALSLMAVLSPANRGRVLEEAVRLDESVLGGLLDGVLRNDAWRVLVEALRHLSADAERAILDASLGAAPGAADRLLAEAEAAGHLELVDRLKELLDSA